MKKPVNVFFKLAMARAISLAGKPGRVLSLLTQLALKIKNTKGANINAVVMREQFLLIGRFLKAQVTGKYKMKSPKLLFIMLAAVIYFINPLDLIPDLLFGIGLTDDFAVLSWVLAQSTEELAAFKAWEQTQTVSIDAQTP
jgi:uncharacterized membrane protein YkvA (DUF1232 family)